MIFTWKKEFIKLLKTLITLALINIGVALYYFFTVRGVFISDSANMVWLSIIDKESFFFDEFRYALYVTAVFIGVVQFYTETINKCFRISCHLPISEFKMTTSMVSFGFIAITVIWLFDLLVAYIVAAHYFPSEISSQIPLIMFFWYATSLMYYGIASAVVLEQSWLHRVALLLILLPATQFLDVNTYYPSTCYVLIAILLSIAYMMTVHYPASRYRTRG